MTTYFLRLVVTAIEEKDIKTLYMIECGSKYINDKCQNKGDDSNILCIMSRIVLKNESKLPRGVKTIEPTDIFTRLHSL